VSRYFLDRLQSIRVFGKKQRHRRLHYASHIGQDAWVAECLQFKSDGFFLDFGAFDGETISNTYVLEKELGWRGICVEPNPRFYPNLCHSRKCISVNVALWPQSRELLRFVDAHGLSTIEAYKDADANAGRRLQATHGVIEVETLNPTELLRRFNAPELIDFLSLDVEGAEYEVLSALDFRTYAIALMTVEHNHDLPRQDKIRAYLAQFGYEVVQNRNDDFFFHRAHLARLSSGSRRIMDPMTVFQRVYRSYGINEPWHEQLTRLARASRRFFSGRTSA
jgi:FkbM family methyltransferase